MIGFDLEKYIKNSKKVDTADFDFAEARRHGLTSEEVRCLHYMMDVESHTIFYMRGLLRTCVVDDPETTSFLPCWAYEEFFHGRTIRELLKACDVDVDSDRFAQVRRNSTFLERWIEAISPLVCRITPHFNAVYLTWGAIQELTSVEAYGVLARRTRNPVLQSIAMRLAKDERRHFSFYYNKARAALESTAAQRLTGRMLRKFWAPVGSGVNSDSDVEWTMRFVFGDREGVEITNRVDSTIARLPGLEWFNMLSRLHAVDEPTSSQYSTEATS